MFGRKRRDAEAPQDDQVQDLVDGGGEGDGEVDGEVEVAAEDDGGPWDVSQVDVDGYVDLGSLLVKQREGLELRLQVDEQSGAVLAAMLVGEDGVLEVRAFASSRGGDLWTQARQDIAADTIGRGGSAEEVEGAFGTELTCQVPVTGPNGEELTQPSRVIGVTGDRWFLRATIAGMPVVEPERAGPYEAALRDLAVRRGTDPMSPGQALSLALPPEARRVD
jgi:hypothetical protein